MAGRSKVRAAGGAVWRDAFSRSAARSHCAVPKLFEFLGCIDMKRQTRRPFDIGSVYPEIAVYPFFLAEEGQESLARQALADMYPYRCEDAGRERRNRPNGRSQSIFVDRPLAGAIVDRSHLNSPTLRTGGMPWECLPVSNWTMTSIDGSIKRIDLTLLLSKTEWSLNEAD
jgi:hypothetical protein